MSGAFFTIGTSFAKKANEREWKKWMDENNLMNQVANEYKPHEIAGDRRSRLA